MAKTQTDHQFLRDYVDYLNGILHRSVTDSQLVLLAGPNPNTRVVERFQARETLPLELAPRGFLFFRQLVRRQRERVIVEQCQYMFSRSDDRDDEEQWVFRYEYVRAGHPDKPYAHVHINAIHPHIDGIDFSRIHFPTGRMSIEQILAHLIMEHGIQPKTPDAISLLAESHKGFMRRRTDLDDPPFP